MSDSSLGKDDIERTRLAYQATGSIKGAAKMLGIARRTMQHRMKYVRDANPPKFTAPEIPSTLPTIEELLDQRTAQGDRSLASENARHLIPIDLHVDGPYGLWVWGDPHLDDNGCNLRLLREHVELARHPAIFSCQIGDICNFWPRIGRLAALYAQQSTTIHEAIMLAEWFLSQHEQLFVVLGNHDCWQGSGLENPLNWIMRHSGSVTEDHGVRLALKSPCGSVTRLMARHTFRGNSQYNINHGMRRELAFGHRDHVLVSGHLHSGGDQGVCHDGDGMVSQLVRVSGYKQVDHYANQLGFPPQKIHPSALIIVDPREPETSRARAWCAPTVEMGVKLLDAVRADYESSKEKASDEKRASNRSRKQPSSNIRNSR